MTVDNTISGELEPTIFSATITPHRSLGNAGFLVLMIVFGAVSFLSGIAFLLMGAWPVFGFFGLDVLLLYWALRLNYRHAAAYEEIKVTASALTVRKVNHRGQSREWRLNPLWVKLDTESTEEFGIARLFLVTRGKQLTVASGKASRESLATPSRKPGGGPCERLSRKVRNRVVRGCRAA